MTALEEVFTSERTEIIAGLAGQIVESGIRFYSLPENRAYLAGCMVGAVMAPRRIRPIGGLMIVMGTGLAFRGAWKFADSLRSDIRAIAEASAAEPADA